MAEEVTKLMILIAILSLQMRGHICHITYQENCSNRDGFFALHKGCSHSCASDGDCTPGERCLCDQKCGFSCVPERPKDCRQPQHSAYGYAILPNPPIDNFGQRIEFGCTSGVLYGTKTLSCLSNGDWSGPIPQCFQQNAEVPCGDPPHPPDHASWNRIPRAKSLTFVCSEGHVLDGEADILCSRSTGVWSPVRGRCQPHLCPPPGRFANVIQIGLNYSVSSSVHYKCEAGYNLHGPAVRTCLENRTWSDSSPECVAKTCPQLTPGTHLTIQGRGVGSSHMVHDVVQFSCSEGFTLTSFTNCTCQTDGQWSCGGAPNCTAIRCQLSSPTGRLRYSDEPVNDWLNYNEVIRYKCIDPSSMVIHGDAARTCYDADRLDGTEPSCKLKCEELGTTPSNAIRINSPHEHLHHGGYVIYVCQERYRMIGTNRFVCQDGQWTAGDFPQCVLDETGQHDYQIRVSDNFTMVDETVIAYEGDQYLVMSCKVRSSKLPKWYFNLGSNLLRGSMETRNGWHKLFLPPLQRSMSGNYSCVVRGDSGKFVNISLVVRAWCPDLGPIANGSMYPSEGIMQVGDFVNFECDTGFHISGVSTIGCRAGGTWSGPKPTCLIDTCEMNLPTVLHSVLIERTYETAENLTGNLTVSCKIGFERIGDERMRCTDAKWTYTVNRQPSCQKNSTVQIKEEITEQFLDHGTVLIKENDTLHLSCILPDFSTKFKSLKDGRYYDSTLLIEYFSYQDVGKYACQKEEDGMTVQVIDVKILPKCIDFRYLENGYLPLDDARSDAFYHGDTIEFKCNEGYQLFGSSKCYCHEGNWYTDIAFPICLPDINVTVTTDPMSYQQGEMTQYEGEEIILTCNVESQYGLDDLIDKYSFGWSFAGDVISNGTFYEEAKSENNVLRLRIRSMIQDFEGAYSCGTKLTKATVFVRMLKHCPDIDAPSNGRVHTSRGFARPRKSTFSCNARYRLEGHHVLHCLPNGQWDQVKPTCQATECEPIAIQNGRWLETSFTVGSILSFVCNDGYSVTGPKENLSCLPDGTWNSTVPICTPVCDQKSCPLGKKCQVVNGEAACVCLQLSDCVQNDRLTVADRVCGSNAKTFSSACHLHAISCVETGPPTVRMLHRGTCEIGGRCRSKPMDSLRATELGKRLDFGKFYFNGRQCLMAPFGYGLQMGTGFDDKSQCEQICIRQNACLVPHVEGPCDKSVPRWAYDVGVQGCRKFNYSGCGGNENNFETVDQCIQTCPDQCLACERTVSLSDLCSQNTTFILSHVTRVNSYATGIAKFRLVTSHVARPAHKENQPMNEELDLQELSLNRNQDVCFCPRLLILKTPYLISIDDQREKISDPTFAEPWDLKLQTQFLATRSCFPYIGKLVFADDTSLFRHL